MARQTIGALRAELERERERTQAASMFLNAWIAGRVLEVGSFNSSGETIRIFAGWGPRKMTLLFGLLSPNGSIHVETPASMRSAIRGYVLEQRPDMYAPLEDALRAGWAALTEEVRA